MSHLKKALQLSSVILPVGVQIIGASFDDRTTIAFAKGLSKLIGGFVPPPGYDD
jgi:amidase